VVQDKNYHMMVYASTVKNTLEHRVMAIDVVQISVE
jgi:hypothetical protein